MANREAQVHFDFVVSAADAEVIFDLITEAENRSREIETLGMSDGDTAPWTDDERKWHGEHANYLKELRAKMHNTKETV